MSKSLWKNDASTLAQLELPQTLNLREKKKIKKAISAKHNKVKYKEVRCAREEEMVLVGCGPFFATEGTTWIEVLSTETFFGVPSIFFLVFKCNKIIIALRQIMFFLK